MCKNHLADNFSAAIFAARSKGVTARSSKG